MTTVDFLPQWQLEQYRTWLKSQDQETLSTYFGAAVNDSYIDTLVDRIVSDPANNLILVAQRGTTWLGTIHLAVAHGQVELGVIVHRDYRKQGVADAMMERAILWSRNRGHSEVYLHCLSWNVAIKRLCLKHGLSLHSEMGETDGRVELPPPNWMTYNQEVVDTTINRTAAFYLKLFDSVIPA